MSTYVLTHTPTTITNAINVTGTAVYGNAGTAWNVTNLTSIYGSNIAIDLAGGGTIINGRSATTTAQIAGYDAIVIAGKPGTIANFGTISGQGIEAVGIILRAGGRVTNGSPGDTAALITGYGGDAAYQAGVRILAAAGTIGNFGTIGGETGVYLADGGLVANSGAGARINAVGYSGVAIAAATGSVDNTGTITGHGDGVYLAKGTVNNGAAALISALNGYGVVIAGAAARVVNDGGQIHSGLNAAAVYLADGGAVTNEGAGAQIVAQSSEGVEISRAAGAVINTATIVGGSAGVALFAGGSVTNSGAGATITGRNGIEIKNAGGKVANTGTVAGNGTSGTAGIYLDDGGAITNGSASVRTALISGYDGVLLTDTGAVVNFGTIVSSDGTVAAAVSLLKGGSVVNGSTAGTAALVDGSRDGVLANGLGTAINFSTIQNFDSIGYGVYFAGGGSVTNGNSQVRTARIIGASDGVVVLGAAATIVNRGTIAATDSFGIGLVIGGGGSITNGAAGAAGGLIEGVAAGLYVTANSAPLAIVDFGTIAGTGTSSVGIDIVSQNAAANTLTIFGTVSGHYAAIVLAGGDDNRLVLEKSAVLKGAVSGGGNGEVDFTQAGAAPFSTFIGFAKVRLDNGVAHSLTIDNHNFTHVNGSTIAVYGGNDGNTISAAGVSAPNRVVMFGGAGKDVLTGGAGNDVFEFAAANLTATDTVKGGAGLDTLVLTTPGASVITGVSGVEKFELANGGKNTLTLANGNFTGITGGTITVVGGVNGNTISEAGVAATHAARLIGGNGADTLIAGQHAIMTGGAGADLFEFTTPGSTTTPDNNIITDFLHRTDRIAFSNSGFALGLTGAGATPKPLPARLFSPSTAGVFNNTTERFAYDKANGDLRYSAQGSAGTDHLVAVLTTHPTVTIGDLFFVT